ncbi:TPA: DNA-binding protein [Streptococcus pneumoniae]
MEIKYVSVENSVAEWADKKSILKRWEGLNLYTINPTHKLVFINLEGFECFLRWKQKRTK